MAFDTYILQELLQETSIGYVTWVIPAVLLMLLAFTISRNINDVKIILFPLAIMMQATGMDMGIIILLSTGFLFAVETFSFDLIGDVISSTTRVIGEAVGTSISFLTGKEQRIREKEKRDLQNIYWKRKVEKQELEMERLDQLKERDSDYSSKGFPRKHSTRREEKKITT